MRIIYSLLITMLCTLQAGAQCIDSTRIDPYNTRCQMSVATFAPVCGCGKTTFFNSCFAENNGGILPNGWAAGVCPNTSFYFNFYPNPVIGNNYSPLNFFFQFRNPDDNSIPTLMIMDLYGKIKFQRKLSPVNGMDYFAIDETYLLQTGINFLIVQTSTERQVKKFIVVNFN